MAGVSGAGMEIEGEVSVGAMDPSGRDAGFLLGLGRMETVE